MAREYDVCSLLLNIAPELPESERVFVVNPVCHNPIICVYDSARRVSNEINGKGRDSSGLCDVGVFR